MTRLWHRLLWLTICLKWGLAAPIDTSETSQESNESHREPVTLSTYGNLAINLGLAAGGTLGTILAAEWALHMIKALQRDATRLKHDNVVRGKDLAFEKEKATREQEALETLIEIAQKHAQGFSSDDFEGKFARFTVPREIHKSLESIFKDGIYGTSNDIRTWSQLKENLKPLLDFE